MPTSFNKGINTKDTVHVSAYDWYDQVELDIPGLSGALHLNHKEALKLSKALRKAAKIAKLGEND